MANMTKPQLAAKLAAALHNNEILATRIASLEAEVEHLKSQQPLSPADAPTLIKALRERGMPRFMQHGREVLPTIKQLTYWASRLGEINATQAH